MTKSFLIDRDLPLNTPLYRYVTIESFISSVEARQLYLTHAILWPDPWEMLAAKIPLVSAEGKISSSNSVHKDLYGQCWSRLKESDAMWRIYSPSKTGVQIATSVEKFTSLEYNAFSYLGNVIYYKTAQELLEKTSPNITRHPWDFALYKRDAFIHEQEVRLLTHGQYLPNRPMHVSIPIDPHAFIEGVTLDPRAEDWYVNAMAMYCERVGLAVKPVKSSLYEPDPHLKAGLVRSGSWVPVKNDNKA
jgi:hypothetical protein